MSDRTHYEKQPEVLPPTDPTTTARVDLDELGLQLDAAVVTLLEYSTEYDSAVQGLAVPVGAQAAANTLAEGTAALLAELRAHREREVFLECPACEQPCRTMPGDPNPQWQDGDSGDCACGALVMVEADDGYARLVPVETDEFSAPPAVKEPT